MSNSKILRLALLAPALGAALAAHGQNAYSNYSGTYFNNGYLIGPSQTVGYQFTSGLTTTLGGVTIAMNNAIGVTGTLPFTLTLSADSGTNTVGTTLGSYSGLSTGVYAGNVTSGGVFVPATGAPVALTSGAKYWLVATSTSNLAWSWTDNVTTQASVLNGNYANFKAAAFSVQAVPEPTAWAGLAVGLLALRRRRAARR